MSVGIRQPISIFLRRWLNKAAQQQENSNMNRHW